MERTRSEEQKRAGFVEEAEGMHKRLSEWRRMHPKASFDEIAAQVSEERKVLSGNLLAELASAGAGEMLDAKCVECGGALQNKGKKKREVLHREGRVKLERNYYYCPDCERGFFPPGSTSGAWAAWVESRNGANGATPRGGDSLV